jgi:hypothetical protein
MWAIALPSVKITGGVHSASTKTSSRSLRSRTAAPARRTAAPPPPAAPAAGRCCARRGWVSRPPIAAVRRSAAAPGNPRARRLDPAIRGVQASLRSELFGVEDDLAQLGIAYPISLFRAPFDEPYLAHWRRMLGWEIDDRGYDRIAPIAGERMVHIGWNIDSDDWRCPSDRWEGATCAFESIRTKLERGDHGIIRMHASSPRTAPALALLLDYLDAHGYRVVMVEDAVCHGFGATSADVIAGGPRCTAPGDGDAGDD